MQEFAYINLLCCQDFTPTLTLPLKGQGIWGRENDFAIVLWSIRRNHKLVRLTAQLCGKL